MVLSSCRPTSPIANLSPMGAYVLNLVGAIITSTFLLGLIFHRPPVREWEEFLQRLGTVVRAVLALFFLLINTSEAFGPTNILQSIPLISWPSYLLENLTFWFHEGGHVYWSWAGPFLHSLGGTLNEVGLPLVFLFLLFRKQCYLLGSLMVLWLGHNLFGISVYMADASVLALKDLTGDGIHDWHMIFSTLNALPLAKPLSWVVWGSGCLVSLLGGFLFLFPGWLYGDDEEEVVS